MGKQQDRADAMTTLVAAQRAQKVAAAAASTSLTGFLVGVAVNTITQPQIDGIVAAQVSYNAATAAYDAAVIAANAAVRTTEG